jgi:hypothetical protein
VFTSAHGDLAIVDALCRTLAHNPLLLSPMRFHHSVHNAASGYWAIGCRSHEASTAVAAGAHSWAAGLLEALTQTAADERAVLLVAATPKRWGRCSRSTTAAAAGAGPGAGAGHRRRPAPGWSLRDGPCDAVAACAAPRRASAAGQCPGRRAAAVRGAGRQRAGTLTLPLSATLALALAARRR